MINFNLLKKMSLGAGAPGFLKNFTRDSTKNLNLSIEGNRMPRYIYHFTSKKNAELIFNSGYLEPADDMLFGKGCFAVDLQNFLKRWKHNRLISFGHKETNELTLLKISTKELNKDLLKIRDIDVLTPGLDFHILINKKRKYFCQKYNVSMDELCKLMEQNPNIKKEIESELEPFIKKVLLSSGLTPLLKGKKKAIEFMYPEPIPISAIEQLGTTNTVNKNAQEILSELLVGYPEEQALKILKKLNI